MVCHCVTVTCHVSGMWFCMILFVAGCLGGGGGGLVGGQGGGLICTFSFFFMRFVPVLVQWAMDSTAICNGLWTLWQSGLITFTSQLFRDNQGVTLLHKFYPVVTDFLVTQSCLLPCYTAVTVTKGLYSESQSGCPLTLQQGGYLCCLFHSGCNATQMDFCLSASAKTVDSSKYWDHQQFTSTLNTDFFNILLYWKHCYSR